MEQQKLTLVIEKGPRSGETLNFLPTNPPIKLGRVVRGNSLPIKDPGISTKHLTIEFKSNNWVITDLDSSNGTFVNSDQLDAFVPRVLVDGDSVKVGEVTVIRVLVSGESDGGLGSGFVVDLENKVPRGRLRRGKLSENVDKIELGFGEDLGKKGPRGRLRRENVGEIAGKGELGIAEEFGKKGPRGRPRRENVGVVEEKIKLGFGEELGKRARGRPKKEKVVIFTENVGPVESIQGKRQVCTRSTRGLTNDTNKSLSNSSLDVEIGDVVDEAFEKKNGRGKGRRGKEKAAEGEGLGPVKAEPRVQVSTRRTRSARVVENEVKVNVEAVKVGEKGNSSKRKLGSEDGLDSERVVVKNEPRESFIELENLGNDNEESERGGECVNASGFMDGEALDLEKMTLGEYFDYLEVALPKQIIEETEIIIAEMHKKAEMYREYVREHKDKGNNK